MSKLLAERDRVGAVQRGFHMMSTEALKAALQDRMIDRESELYRKSRDWSERVEDLIDDLEVEIERRDARSRIGL